MFIINTKSLELAKLKEYSLILGYFVCLFSTTCFFFDAHKVVIESYIIQLPIALTFFPLTFAISNIIQDKYGKVAANSLTLLAFVFDTLLVFMLFFLAAIGDRNDYWSVFKDIPTIMLSTWVFMGIGSVFNIILYGLLTKKSTKNNFIIMLRFFISITITEILTSAMSMPLLFYKHGLEGSLMLTITISVVYKVMANIVISVAYVLLINKTKQKFVNSSLPSNKH